MREERSRQHEEAVRGDWKYQVELRERREREERRRENRESRDERAREDIRIKWSSLQLCPQNLLDIVRYVTK